MKFTTCERMRISRYARVVTAPPGLEKPLIRRLNGATAQRESGERARTRLD